MLGVVLVCLICFFLVVRFGWLLFDCDCCLLFGCLLVANGCAYAIANSVVRFLRSFMICN